MAKLATLTVPGTATLSQLATLHQHTFATDARFSSTALLCSLQSVEGTRQWASK
jgi:hypothetical protein